MAFALVWSGSAASAQALFSGSITGHLGAAHGGDVREAAPTAGFSLAVLDDSGFGAEFDVAHSASFDDERFAESSVTSVMLNFIAMYPHPTVRPFLAIGAGVLRVRAAFFEDQPVFSRTDVGMNVGGGVHYSLSDAFAVRGDVRYLRHFEGHADVPVLEPGFFDYWRSTVGVTFSWPIR